MEMRKVIEKDKGPVVRFIADLAISFAAFLLDRFGAYATKYEYVWDREPFDYLEIKEVSGEKECWD